jgi:hypothetical protein
MSGDKQNPSKPEMNEFERGVFEAKGQEALRELFELRRCDVTQSSGWPRITIMIQQGGKDDVKQCDVWVNGRPYNLWRGIAVAVPPEVVDNLTEAKTGFLQEIPLGPNQPNKHETVDVMRFPFHVVDAESATRYALWQESHKCNAYMHCNPPEEGTTAEDKARVARWKAECAKTRERDMRSAIDIVARVKTILEKEQRERARLRESVAA